MTTPLRRHWTASTGAAFAAAALLALPLADTASALDPRPATQKSRARHDFRDVQLGLCHPADATGSSRSTKCTEARAQESEPKQVTGEK